MSFWEYIAYCLLMCQSSALTIPLLIAETEMGIFREILQGKLDFESEPWPGISDSAKDLLRNMLERNPKKRLTAHEALCKPVSVLPSCVCLQLRNMEH